MSDKEYFIYLLSCHLNGAAPDGKKNTDWRKIYNLAEKHSVTAIITQEIKQLPKEFMPQGKLLSAFNQKLGYTEQGFEFKMQTLSVLISVLSAAKIPHLLVKGAVLRSLYPVAELRTGEDTDVVIRQSDLIHAVDILKEKGFETECLENNLATLKFGNEYFEIHTELENINVQSKIYFSTPFDDISECSGYTYKLKPIYHLLYVITHIAHHLKAGGAGIRMIMDIDVLIRNYPDIDMAYFMNICENIRIRKTAQALIALSKKWFDTPVAIDFTFEDKDNLFLYGSLFQTMLDGGAFGEAGKNTIERNIGKKGKETFFSWLKRLFLTLFGRFLKSGKSAGQMFALNGKEISGIQHELIEELEIKD